MEISFFQNDEIGKEDEPLTSEEAVHILSTLYAQNVFIEKLGEGVTLSRTIRTSIDGEERYMFMDTKRLFHGYMQEEMNLAFDTLTAHSDTVYILSMHEAELMVRLKPVLFRWIGYKGGLANVKGTTFKFATWSNPTKWDTLTL